MICIKNGKIHNAIQEEAFIADILIENGKITSPVRGATLAGNGPESLRNVEMVGNDLGYAIGTCGKNGQRVPVADAQPTLKINGLTVGGTGTEKR